MEFRFTLRDNAMRAAFQLLHMVLEVILTKTTYLVVHTIIVNTRYSSAVVLNVAYHPPLDFPEIKLAPFDIT